MKSKLPKNINSTGRWIRGSLGVLLLAYALPPDELDRARGRAIYTVRSDDELVRCVPHFGKEQLSR